MAAVSCVLSEDQFLCSICLEVFTDPVTTPCGHSFCKTCINKHWDNSDHCNCPICKEDFSTRPQMKLNTIVAEMASQFKNKPQIEKIVCSEPQSVEPGEVDCDVCSEPRLKALKSCLVCLASYCQSHLEPHITNPRLKRHQLIEPLKNLEDRICPEHDRPLELICRNDSLFICLQCSCAEHESHNTVPLKVECEVKQAELQERIKERREKIEEIQSLVEHSQKNADQVFNALMECVQQSLNKFKQGIEEKHKKTEEEAAELIEKIKTELSELEQRRAEMGQLWSSGDHLHFLQTFTSVKPAPELNDWTKVDVCSTYEGTLAKAVSQLRDNELSQEIKKVFVADFKRLQQFVVDVTLNPDTAHPNLDVLCYSKKVQYTSSVKNLEYNSERFNSEHCVLGQQMFYSGRFYFEVEVKGTKNWAVGVAKESVRRKGNIQLTPQYGFWLLEWDRETSWQCKVGGEKLYLECMPWRTGVFVDYEEGLVSFYNVYKAELIKSLTGCSFTGNLLPLLSPGDRYGALQIAPV